MGIYENNSKQHQHQSTRRNTDVHVPQYRLTAIFKPAVHGQPVGGDEDRDPDHEENKPGPVLVRPVVLDDLYSDTVMSRFGIDSLNPWLGLIQA